MKLGKRLKKLNEMCLNNYEHIWDCCCDHGLLGINLLDRQAAPTIHFVDIVPELIEALNLKLVELFPATPNNQTSWKTYCSDASQLPLDKHQGKHLVIIAGVGGDETINLISQLHQKFQNLDIDYLLCPVYHQYALRQHLIKLDFSLLDEQLVKERKQFYEILHVSSCSGLKKEISPAGRKIWQGETEVQAEIAHEYLARVLSHYKKSRINHGDKVDEVIRAYELCAEHIQA